jgi:hypothetical protein
LGKRVDIADVDRHGWGRGIFEVVAVAVSTSMSLPISVPAQGSRIALVDDQIGDASVDGVQQRLFDVCNDTLQPLGAADPIEDGLARNAEILSGK